MKRVNRRSQIGVLILIMFPVTASSQDIHDAAGHHHRHDVRQVRPVEFYAPSAMPDRVILTLNEDPRTTQTVSWRTSVDVVTGLAEIAVAEAGPNFAAKAKRVEAISESLKSDLSTAHYHNVVFRDLQPGTVYAYRVGDGTNWSEWFQFRTASQTAEAFSFVYFGDAQNDIRSMWSRVIREAHRDAPKAAFLLHAGDLVNRAESDAEWGEWFGAGGWVNAMTPSVAIPGNHEHVNARDGKRRRLSHHWRKVFAFPEHGPRGLEETCFTLTYHNLRIIGLNSNEMHQQQAKWLENVLAENESTWVICTFHHPVFSTAKERDNPELRALWKPILDRYKVDLVLQGHDHTYGRSGFDVPRATAAFDEFALAGDAPDRAQVQVGQTNLSRGVSNIDTQTGTVYVVSVSGPKMYDNSRLDFMKRVAEDTQLYQVIHVDGDTLRYESRTAVGQLYDAFVLKKQENSINKLIELNPDVRQNQQPEVEPTGVSRLP